MKRRCLTRQATNESWTNRHQLHLDFSNSRGISFDEKNAIEVLEKHVEFVGLTERFDESLVLLRSWSNEPGLDIRYRARNMAPDNRIKKQLLRDPAIVDMLERMHEEDAKVYRYARDVIYPRQLERHGDSLAENLAQLQDAPPYQLARKLGRFWGCTKRNLLYKPLTRHVWRRTA